MGVLLPSSMLVTNHLWPQLDPLPDLTESGVKKQTQSPHELFWNKRTFPCLYTNLNWNFYLVENKWINLSVHFRMGWVGVGGVDNNIKAILQNIYQTKYGSSAGLHPINSRSPWLFWYHGFYTDQSQILADLNIEKFWLWPSVGRSVLPFRSQTSLKAGKLPALLCHGFFKLREMSLIRFLWWINFYSDQRDTILI